MANTKISAFTDGVTAAGSDRIAAARSPFGSTDNRYLTPDYLDTYMASTTKTLSNKTFVAPVLGAATATSINKVALTAPATTATLTIANNKTLTVSNTITLAGTDSTTMTFPATSDIIPGVGTANTFTAQQTFANGTITASTPTNFTQTWNNAGVTFQGIKLNVTNTASSSSSSLLDLQVGGVNRFQISRDGTATIGGNGTLVCNNITSSAGTTGVGLVYHHGGISMGGAAYISFTGAANGPGTSSDAFLSRNTAGVLSVGSTSTIGDFGGGLKLTSIGLNVNAPTASFLAIAAGTTAKAQINFTASTAPTSPSNGDFWFDGTDVKIRVGGVTKTFTLT